LRDDDIPLLAKVISVADAYNAMTSDRPYRQAMPTEVARGRLRESAGSQFDPIIVEAFDTVLDQRPESYRCGKSPEFQLEPLTTAPRLLRAA
jgi:HD-GYP domain-containing protein (c-di-GMP phosphodiesterase class II)